MRRSRPYRDQRYQGRFSERKFFARVRKPRPYQGGNALTMEEWEGPHIKMDLATHLPVFDVHSNVRSFNLGINKGKLFLRRIIQICIEEGVNRFFVIHGTSAARNGRRTWLQFLKKLFGDAMKIAWRKNKGVSVVYLHKLPPFKLYELMHLSLAA